MRAQPARAHADEGGSHPRDHRKVVQPVVLRVTCAAPQAKGSSSAGGLAHWVPGRAQWERVMHWSDTPNATNEPGDVDRAARQMAEPVAAMRLSGAISLIIVETDAIWDG